MMDTAIEYLTEIMNDGIADVECAECGHAATIEPDGDYPCPESGCNGRLTSPLIIAGVI